jgi:hypothetical protein
VPEDECNTGADIVNRPPVAVDDELVTRRNVAGSVDVLANDSDPDGDALTVTEWGQGAHGAVACEPSGECTYTPEQDFVGADAFGYTVSDVWGATDTATVHVTVRSATLGDFLGDGKADIAVWRPSNSRFLVFDPDGPNLSIRWGTGGDIPVPADYTGDGKANMAVFRPSNGRWLVRVEDGTNLNIPFGNEGDIPLQIPAAVRQTFLP